MDVPAAWQLTQGAGVVVAVIDSGVYPDVSDLAGSVLTGPDHTGVSTPPSNPDWGVHGTWMASLIAGHGTAAAAAGSSASRRASTDPVHPGHPGPADPQLPARTSTSRSRTSRTRWPRPSTTRSAPGQGDQHVDRLQRAERRRSSRRCRTPSPTAWWWSLRRATPAPRRGSSEPARPPYSFPADYPGVISVAAVDHSGSVGRFSSDNLSVQVAAPGVNVPAQGRDGQYWLVSGTSPACALTAGVAALIKSKYPGLAPSPGRQRPHLDHHEPAARRLRQPGRVRHRRRGRGAGPGGQAGRRPARRRRGLAAAARFGGGPAAVPAAPVHRRGSGQLVLFVLFALISLVLAGRRRHPAGRPAPHRPPPPRTPGSPGPVQDSAVTPDSQ